MFYFVIEVKGFICFRPSISHMSDNVPSAVYVVIHVDSLHLSAATRQFKYFLIFSVHTSNYFYKKHLTIFHNMIDAFS